mmetsp:Transcript_3585/g.8214  ORF Transcript_3585/g.8214 Transcript_3585/m.8214 type:complete len:372 (+) Transcript_3585:597-1712(+)
MVPTAGWQHQPNHRSGVCSVLLAEWHLGLQIGRFQRGCPRVAEARAPGGLRWLGLLHRIQPRIWYQRRDDRCTGQGGGASEGKSVCRAFQFWRQLVRPDLSSRGTRCGRILFAGSGSNHHNRPNNRRFHRRRGGLHYPFGSISELSSEFGAERGADHDVWGSIGGSHIGPKHLPLGNAELVAECFSEHIQSSVGGSIGVPERHPECIAERVAERVPERVPERDTELFAERDTERVPELFAERVSELFAELFAERVPERVSERVPESFAEHVFVGDSLVGPDGILYGRQELQPQQDHPVQLRLGCPETPEKVRPGRPKPERPARQRLLPRYLQPRVPHRGSHRFSHTCPHHDPLVDEPLQGRRGFPLAWETQ